MTDQETTEDDRDNNLIVTGAIMAWLKMFADEEHGEPLTSIEVVADAEGQPTNQIAIRLSFMNSPYRITVERIRE